MNATIPEHLRTTSVYTATAPETVSTHYRDKPVSWQAVLAGAAGAAALSLILLVLGVGLGLSSVSPWSQAGIAAATFGVSTILWVTFTQVAASALGGYLAGRLRAGWQRTSTDEVHFRDTAHGFLAWAVATLSTAALLTGAIGSVLSTGAQTAAVLAGATGTAAVGAASTAAPNHYFEDALFRPAPNLPASSTPVPAATVSEVATIFANAGRSPTLPPADLTYVGQVVAKQQGISQQDAEKRVNDVYAAIQQKMTQAQEAADKARKASAHAALWLFVSLLAGAFVASLAATFGGRQRDLDAARFVVA